jgi:squalene-hopene/tetraprenyl-beta-curcumene cyclase
VQYLIETQCEDGSWSEAEYTGTGFPCHFYLTSRYYPLYFPAIALARYRATYATEETEPQTSA